MIERTVAITAIEARHRRPDRHLKGHLAVTGYITLIVPPRVRLELRQSAGVNRVIAPNWTGMGTA